MVTGIVAEYNPFHNGHRYHINKTREIGADYIVSVMSGNFVQRGECACKDKWLRAKAAVLCGADIVLDLPTPWSCASAETFARGSVGLLMSFGVDSLSFGCETDDPELLKKCAGAIDDERVASVIKAETAKGSVYPAAAQQAIGEIFGAEAAEIINSPNNTLAIEYIRQLMRYGKADSIIPVKRLGADHDSISHSRSIASAGFIRQSRLSEDSLGFIPRELLPLYADSDFYSLINCEKAIISRLRYLPKEEYQKFVSDTTGLLSRIFDSAKTAESLEALYENAKSKNYTLARVRREVMNIYLGSEKQWCRGVPPYIKILAANERGLSLLAKVKENTSLPIITKHSEGEKLTGTAKEIYEAECRNTDQFFLMGEKIRECGLEKTHSLIIVK